MGAMIWFCHSIICSSIHGSSYYSYFDAYMLFHYSNVIMSMMGSQITGITIVYSTVCSGAHQRKHQSSPSLTFVGGIHWWIPRTKGHQHGKCFHLMTSSCLNRLKFININLNYIEIINILINFPVSWYVSWWLYPNMAHLVAYRWIPIYELHRLMYMGQVTKLRLSCYLVLLSIDSKTR